MKNTKMTKENKTLIIITIMVSIISIICTAFGAKHGVYVPCTAAAFMPAIIAASKKKNDEE